VTQALGDFTYQNSGEDEPFGFDFTTSLPAGVTITSIDSITAIDVLGVDPAPNNRIGTQTLVGNLVGFMFGPPIVGAKYAISALVNCSNSAKVLLWAFLDTEQIGC